jgi:hypothetical protein
MIGKEHHAKISGLEHGERHIFKCKEGNEYGCWRNGDNLHFKRHSHDSGLYSNMSTIVPVPMWNNQDAMGQDKPVSEEVVYEAAPFKTKEDAVKYAKEKVKTHRDNLDGIEIHSHSGGFDVNHTSNSSGRNSLQKIGAKHLGTIYKEDLDEATKSRRMSAAVKLHRAFERERAKSTASNERDRMRRELEGIASRMKPKESVKEDVYSSDTRTKKVQVQDKDGNWVFKDRKSHPHRINFAASKMNGKPAQSEDPTKNDTEANYQKYLDKQKKQNEAWVLNPDGKTKKKYKDIKDNKTLSISNTAPFDAFSNTNNQT